MRKPIAQIGKGLSHCLPVSAQHLEGGPEAQLYIHVGAFRLEQFGSYETSFRENDSNPSPWPIPNVLAVRPRSTHP